MTQVIATKPASTVAASNLPPDIEAMRKRLLQAKNELNEFRRWADGLIFGKVGLDAGIGIIPIAGEAYTLYAATILMQFAIQAKCRWSTILGGLVMIAIDFAIGMLPVVGDVADLFFRSHAWFAGMVISEIDEKLAHIDEAHRIVDGSAATSEGMTLTTVRDQLFRGGQTQQTIYVRIVVVALVCMFMMHECRRAHEARQETIRACEARGGWFCGVRN